jgi:pimeloyl-ACP methyl ester carboxylesterase
VANNRLRLIIQAMTSTDSSFQIALVFVAAALSLFCCASAFAKCGDTPAPMPKPDKSGCTQSGLNYAIYGTTGEPLLAIHGLGASMYSWREFVKEKNTFPGYQIFLIDLKGAGNSLKPHDKNYSILTQRDLVYQLIQEQNLKNLTLVGNSYGGAVSLIVAIKLIEQNPGLLSKLILIDSGGYNLLLPWYLKLLRTPVLGWLALHILSPRQAADTVLKNAYYNDHLITPEQIAAYAEPIGSPGGRYALLQTAKGVIPKNIDKIIAQYPSINVPTFILWGLDDKVIPLKIGEMLHAAIPGSRLELINECGHVPQEEKPEETICWMRDFLGLLFAPCPK